MFRCCVELMSALLVKNEAPEDEMISEHIARRGFRRARRKRIIFTWERVGDAAKGHSEWTSILSTGHGSGAF